MRDNIQRVNSELTILLAARLHRACMVQVLFMACI
jgi:hypothetical protein